MTDITLRDAFLILPEIILAVSASIILTLDLFMGRTKTAHRVMLVLSLVVVLTGTLYSTWRSAVAPPREAIR